MEPHKLLSAEAIRARLNSLYREARAADLDMTAHFIAVAIEDLDDTLEGSNGGHAQPKPFAISNSPTFESENWFVEGGSGQGQPGVPAEQDVWQAAVLLVSLFGEDAIGYAREQRDRDERSGKPDVWERIILQISKVLTQSERRVLQ